VRWRREGEGGGIVKSGMAEVVVIVDLVFLAGRAQSAGASPWEQQVLKLSIGVCASRSFHLAKSPKRGTGRYCRQHRRFYPRSKGLGLELVLGAPSPVSVKSALTGV
jgi:hypothetical protein